MDAVKTERAEQERIERAGFETKAAARGDDGLEETRFSRATARIAATGPGCGLGDGLEPQQSRSLQRQPQQEDFSRTLREAAGAATWAQKRSALKKRATAARMFQDRGKSAAQRLLGLLLCFLD